MNILESYNKISKFLFLESEDDRYVSIGFGRFKLKGKENDEDAEVFVKTKGGKYVSSADQSSDDKGADTEEPEDGEDLSQGMDAPSDYERDFDDSESEDKPFGGDTGVDADFGYEDDEEAMNQAMKDMEDEFGDEDEWDESVKVINGKKYKKVKEHAWDRKFGEPLPTLTDVMKVKEDKKVTEKHILRENYERFGGK